MKLAENTILITGGGSGIGRGLAEAFHALGNTVIIAGRREGVLQETVTRNPGMEYVVFDQGNAAEIGRLTGVLRKRFPGLNVLLNNAGVQYVEDLTAGDPAATEETININLLAPIRLTAALLPQLLAQPQGAILNVTSALAMVPSAMMPSYCASKAAMHSHTQSLRFQLRNTSLQVIEVIPPWVQTDLQRERGMNPKAMPLKEYIDETMELLKSSTEFSEIVVERSKPMRFAERGDYDVFYKHYNEGWLASQRH